MNNNVDGKDTAFLSEINMIPLIDVSLVLLIIFMVITPYMVVNSIKVQLPKSTSASTPPPKSFVVTVTQAGDILINNEKTSIGDVRNKVNTMKAQFTDGAVIFSDRTVPVSTVVDVIDQIEAGGVSKINLTTELKTTDAPAAAPAVK